MQRNWKEVYWSKNRAKIGQKQGSTRLRSLKESSAKLALHYETISQLNWLLCENFRSCETKFGTRVPLRSTGAPISQLRNGCEAPKRENSQFHSQSSIPQGILQLWNQVWHTSATSQHRNSHFEAAKRLRSSKAPFRRVFRNCEADFGTRVPFRSTVTPISKLRNGLRK